MSNFSNIPQILTRDQVRAVDRIALTEFGLSGVVLMENAGRNSAELLRSFGVTGRVVICCGKGNNGGDGFVIARHLENAGIDVRVLLCTDPNLITGDAATNFRVLLKAKTRIVISPVDWYAEFSQAEWIVDALLGTGTEGIIREPFVTAINAINQSGRRIFSVDIPSGLDCDTGQPLGNCVCANHTATFVARKSGFDVPRASTWTGQVHVVDIGVPLTLLRNLLRSVTVR